MHINSKEEYQRKHHKLDIEYNLHDSTFNRDVG